MILDDTAPCLIWTPCAVLFYLGMAFVLLFEICSKWVTRFRCKPFRVAKFCFSFDNRLDFSNLAASVPFGKAPRSQRYSLDVSPGPGFIVTFPWMITTTRILAGRRRYVDDIHDILRPSQLCCCVCFLPGPGAFWEKSARTFFGPSVGILLEPSSAFCCLEPTVAGMGSLHAAH